MAFGVLECMVGTVKQAVMISIRVRSLSLMSNERLSLSLDSYALHKTGVSPVNYWGCACRDSNFHVYR